jgi:hypothetical protein
MVHGPNSAWNASLERMTRYWRSKINGFTEVFWITDLEHFKVDFMQLLRRQRMIPIELPYDLIVMSNSEMNSLIGTYVTYRNSFYNDGRISREVLRIRKAGVRRQKPSGG